MTDPNSPEIPISHEKSPDPIVARHQMLLK